MGDRSGSSTSGVAGTTGGDGHREQPGSGTLKASGDRWTHKPSGFTFHELSQGDCKPLGKAVRTWSSIVWAAAVNAFIGVVESHAQTPPACVVVEIPADPSDPVPELDGLYAKVDPPESSITAPARYLSGGWGQQRREMEGMTKSRLPFKFAKGLFYRASRGRFTAPSMSCRNRLLQS